MKNPNIFPNIHSHRTLFFYVHQFNLLPTRYIHASWLQELGGAIQTNIKEIWEKNPRSERQCAALIIKTFCHGFVWDFSDSIRCVVLMPSAELAKLIIYAGLAINACSIIRTISGRSIKALTAAFGPEAYEFAITRAPLLTGSRRFEFLLPHGDERDPVPLNILENGRQCLQICLEGLPEPLVRRFCLKFPRSTVWDFKPRSNDTVRTVCRSIIQKIMKMEIRPQW